MPEKKLCKWSEKKIEKHFDTYVELTRKPQFVCMKCGRVAVEKSSICRPKKMTTKQDG